MLRIVTVQFRAFLDPLLTSCLFCEMPQRDSVQLCNPPKNPRRFVPRAGEAVGKSSLVPVPYEWIQKDPGCVAARGLPDGVALKKPSEYDTKTLMKILEQSHRIQFTVKRSVAPPRAAAGPLHNL